MKNFIIRVAIISGLFLFTININIYAECPCIKNLLASVKAKNPEKVLNDYTHTLNESYYSGNSFRGPAVFDLSKRDIREVYDNLFKISPSDFKPLSIEYNNAVNGLKTKDVINSRTYDKDKANLIFDLDRNLKQRYEIYKYQDMLNYIGKDCGKVDGIMGIQTQKALKQFQIEKGLKQTGELDEQIKRLLESEYSRLKKEGMLYEQDFNIIFKV